MLATETDGDVSNEHALGNTILLSKIRRPCSRLQNTLSLEAIEPQKQLQREEKENQRIHIYVRRGTLHLTPCKKEQYPILFESIHLSATFCNLLTISASAFRSLTSMHIHCTCMKFRSSKSCTSQNFGLLGVSITPAWVQRTLAALQAINSAPAVADMSCRSCNQNFWSEKKKQGLRAYENISRVH